MIITLFVTGGDFLMANKKKSALQYVELGLEKFGEGICSVFAGVGKGARYAGGFKKVWLALPVAIAAVWLAIYAGSKYPDYVGIDLLATGDYGFLVTREIAIMGPLAVTAICLLLMFWSKRTLFPWLVSVFSLTLPLLIMLINFLPA